MKADFNELRLDAVSRHFRPAGGGGGEGVAALRDLSLTIKRGEFIALLGPSGCGKSTALNCVAGLLPLSTGGIWLDHTRIDVLPPEKRGFGMVFQNYALFPHMSVRKNIGFGLLMRGLPEAECKRRVDHALTLVQLDGHGDKLPGQLSGGQQQRVAIARAIVIEPTLVLMDEPLSNLDAKLRIETRAEIRRIHRELGRTTVYVTHDQDEALSLADRIVVLREGAVQQVATPEEVYTRPANLHVARFMGYRNVLDFKLGGAGAEPGSVALERAGVSLFGTLGPSSPGRAPSSSDERVCAAIRPDDMAIGPPDAANALPVTVTGVEYCGRDSLIDAHVDHAEHGFDLHFRTSARVSPGDLVHVNVPPERVLVYPAEA